MHDRIVGLFAPVLVLTAVLLGTLLAIESAHSMSLHAEVERLTERDHLASQQLADERRILRNWVTADRTARLTDRWGRVRFEEQAPNALTPSASSPPVEPLAADATVWPWTDGDWVLTATSADGAQLQLGFSTDPVQAQVLRRWAMIAVGVFTGAVALAFATFPLTQWALRPVRELDQAALDLAQGRLGTRTETIDGAPELRVVATAFNEMADRVEAAMHRERAFVASASHHLGNLMTPLRLRIEAMPGPVEDRVEVLAELERLELVVTRLLDLHQAEELASEPVPVDVGALVDELLPFWQAAADAREIPLTREGSAQAVALAVPGAIEEVLDNLLDNAFKYGNGAPITIRVVRGLRHVRLAVKDSGPGLTAEELAQAQGRFWRGSKQQNKPGSGLGLAIVEALAVRCGGSFELRAKDGRGFEGILTLNQTDARFLDHPGVVDTDPVIPLHTNTLGR